MLNIKCKRPTRIYKNSIKRLLLHFRITLKKRRTISHFKPVARILLVQYKHQIQRKNITQVRMGSGISKPFRGYYIIYPNMIFLKIHIQYFYLLTKFLKKLKRNFMHCNLFSNNKLHL